MLRGIGVLIITLLLLVSLFGANVVLGVDRGPLDEDQVTESMEQAGFYEAVHAEMDSQLQDELAEIDDEEFAGIDVPIQDLVLDVVTPEWMQNQTEQTIGDVFAFLEGEQDLELTFRADELREPAEDAILEAMRNLDYEELGVASLGEMRTDAETYEEERVSVREELYAEIGLHPDDGFGHPTLAALIESEQSYETERTAIRDDIVGDVMDDLEAENGFGNEQLQALLVNEQSFEAEQDEFREQQKQRIQEETDEELSDEELEQAYDQQQDEIIATTEEGLVEELTIPEAPIDTEPHVQSLASLTAEALATDMTHATFTAEYDGIVDNLEQDLLDHIAEDPDEYAPEIREDFEAELMAQDLPEFAEAHTDDIIDLGVEAIATDLPYESFMAEYDGIVAAIEADAADEIINNRDEYEDEIDAVLPAEFDDVPGPLEDDVMGFVDLGIEAALTDLSHDEFVTQLEAQEEQLADSTVEYIFEEEDALQEEYTVTEELDEDVEEELEAIQDGYDMVGTAAIGLAILSAVLVGFVLLLSGSVSTAAIVAGFAAAVVGGATMAVIETAIPELEQLIAEEDEVGEELQQASIELLEGLLAPLASQSTILIGAGVVLVVVGIVLKIRG